jgi:uncharacterized DUF497 family protein
MKLINWNSEKNELLKETRNISFEEIVIAINEDKIIDTVLNPNQLKYPNQKMYLISINDYIHVVPFVENGNEIFLKTIIPSRKQTKKYIKDENKA